MEKKIICFGVRNYEIPTFNALASKYGYDLVLRSEYLTDECVSLAEGYECVMVRGNCVLSKDNYRRLYEKGLRYYLTRTAGYNHVDLEMCKELGIESAFVPGYSPNAIAELALTSAMTLLRHVQYTADKSNSLDFKVTDTMFSKEIRECTVGIIGCGRIGRTSASLFYGLGAKVIGYDVFPGKDNEIISYVDLDTLLKTSDVIVMHAAYIAGQNDNMIGENEIAKMKDGVVLVNVARGELLDGKAAVDAIKSGKIDGLAVDVLRGEKAIFNHVFKSIDDIQDEIVKEMIQLYPKVIITPHVASATDGALRDMVEVSLQNMEEYIATGKCKNTLIK